MEMDDATATTAGAGCEGEQRPPLQPHTRIDWRTGRPMLVHGAAFWKEHAARRIEQRPSAQRPLAFRLGTPCADRSPSRVRRSLMETEVQCAGKTT